jgi:DNA-binding CsgD family transcriptional regulator
MVAPNPVTIAAFSSPLSPRLRQTLDGLLRGLAEKQIASELSISRHTVHVYVKQLYTTYNVSSRSELLSRWIGSAPPPQEPIAAAMIENGQTDEILSTLLTERRQLTVKLARLDQRIAAKLERLRRVQRLVFARNL